jgi:hypothetical protein
VDSVKKITASFKLKEVVEPVLVRGKPDASAEERLAAAGKVLAEGCIL